MADMKQCLAQKRTVLRNSRREFQIALPRHCANSHLAFVNANASQTLDLCKIDDVINDHVAEVHHWHQRLAAGENFRIIEACEKFRRLLS